MLNLCDDILNIISEFADMRIETKKYKSLKNSNKMKITKIKYKCEVCEREMPWNRLKTVFAQMKTELKCRNAKTCIQAWLDNNRAQFFNI